MDYERFFVDAIDQLKAEGRYREFAEIGRQVGSFPNAIHHGTNVSNEITVWCSNDYLGMGQNPTVLAAMKEAVDSVGAGSGGTRNISGTTHYHVVLERELANLHQKEAALLFTSGYVANDATLSTLAGSMPNCVILSDEYNHASMIAGVRHSGAEKRIFNVSGSCACFFASPSRLYSTLSVDILNVVLSSLTISCVALSGAMYCNGRF